MSLSQLERLSVNAAYVSAFQVDSWGLIPGRVQIPSANHRLTPLDSPFHSYQGVHLGCHQGKNPVIFDIFLEAKLTNFTN